MVSRAARIIGFVLWGLLRRLFAVRERANPPTAAIRLPISDATDRVFVPISAGEEASHAWVGQIAEDNQGFLWFAARDGLDRYDGYQLRPYSPVPTGAYDSVLFRIRHWGWLAMRCLRIVRAKSGLERTNLCTSTIRKPSALAICRSRPECFRE